MTKRLQPVAVQILGKEYKIACSDDEKEGLLDLAQDLDQQMRQIRDTGKVTSPDRIAVMAALNLTHELRQTQGQEHNLNQSFAESLNRLKDKIEIALEN